MLKRKLSSVARAKVYFEQVKNVAVVNDGLLYGQILEDCGNGDGGTRQTRSVLCYRVVVVCTTVLLYGKETNIV